MNRLLGWLLAGVVLLAALVWIGPMIRGIDWGSGFRSPSDSHLTGEGFRSIQNGMSREAVIAILGHPSTDHMGDHMGNSAGSTDRSRFLVWTDGRKEVTVHFSAEGLVISKTGKGL